MAIRRIKIGRGMGEALALCKADNDRAMTCEGVSCEQFRKCWPTADPEGYFTIKTEGSKKHG